MDFAQLVRLAPRRHTAPSAPWVPAAACLAAALAVLGLGVAGGLAGDTLLVAPVSLALLGLVLAAQRWEERRRACAAADAWIARGYENRASRYGWRIKELTSWRERRLLGRSVRSIVPELAAGRLPGASPLNRGALRPHRAELIALADSLDDVGRPVSAAGILAVRRLLTEPDSVLYARPFFDGQPRNIGAELGAILDRLEVRR
ncbi:MAG: hypothetical protein ABSB24_12610 [Gaiellaceae bacterium]|jgi:hypothetical protein